MLQYFRHTVLAQRPEKILASILFALFLVVVLMALVFRGSVGTAPLTLMAGAMFLLAIPNAVILGEPEHSRMAFRIALCVLLGLAGWTWVQSSAWLPWFQSPLRGAAPVLAAVEGYMGRSAPASLAPADSGETLLRLLMPFVTFLVGLMLCSSDERSRRLITSLGILGGMLALLGLLQFIVSPQALMLGQKRFYMDSLTDVFVNRNTAATFLGVTILILTVLASEEAQTTHLRRVWMQLWDWHSPHRSKVAREMIYLVLLGVSIAALLLTKSRAGIASTFIALVCLLPFVTNWSGRKLSALASHSRRPVIAFVRWIFWTILLLLAFALFAGRVLFRAQVRGADDGRFCVLPNVLHAWSDHRMLGAGLGTFRWLFPAYRDPACGIWGTWNRAHDFYLEGGIALGIVFWLALAIILASVGAILYRGLRNRRKMRRYPALGLAATILVLLHSAVDFSLQIPGFSVFFAAVMGPIVSISLGRHVHSEGSV